MRATTLGSNYNRAAAATWLTHVNSHVEALLHNGKADVCARRAAFGSCSERDCIITTRARAAAADAAEASDYHTTRRRQQQQQLMMTLGSNDDARVISADDVWQQR